MSTCRRLGSPIQWGRGSIGGRTRVRFSGAGPRGELLPDNAMHRAPVPTIHLLRRSDLATVAAQSSHSEALADLELRNATRLRALGWERLRELAEADGIGARRS